METFRKRCLICCCLYKPDPRTAKFQKVCSRLPCRRELRRRKLRRWRVLNPERVQRYRPKLKAWAKAYPDYWRKWRAQHPEYREREKRRMRLKRRQARRVAKETAMPRAVVEKMQALDTLGPSLRVAKETPILRRVEAIEDCLRSTVAALWSQNRPL